jgi:hypothetical protein
MASEAGKGSKPRKITKESRESYEDNYERIWGPKKKPVEYRDQEEWDEIRMDVIGLNGNNGLHYDQDPDPNDM